MLWYKNTAEKVTSQIKDTLVCTMGVNVYIGIGQPYDRAELFYKSYQESQQALDMASKDNPVCFCSGTEDAKLEVIWEKINAIGDDWQTERTFDFYAELIREYLGLIAAESMVTQRKQTAAFWAVVCERCKTAIHGWEAAETYHKKLDEITADLLDSLDGANFQNDIKRLLMQAMVKNIQENHAAKLARPNIFIQKAAAYIDEKYMEDLSLDNVAGHIGISSFYLSHIFQKSLKCSFKDYLTNVRMKKVIQLLKEKPYTIKELASMTGYSNPSYFCKVIKKATGKTVGEIKRTLDSK
jgi:two-component system response regulator YesN